MGSIERRIEALEALYHTSTAPEGGAHRRELVSRAWRQTLDAMARIRRAPIDPPHLRYEVSKLRGESPFTIACHVAALAHLGHEDEEEARRILEEVEDGRGLDGESLHRVADGMVEALDRMREERRGA